MRLADNGILRKPKRQNDVAIWSAVAGVFSFVLLLLLDTPEAYTIGCVLFCAWGLVYSCLRLKERFSLFSFNIGFFIFLISGYFFNWLDMGTMNYFTSSQVSVKHTCFCLYLCMLTVNLFYILMRAKRQETVSDQEMSTSVEIPKIIQQAIACLLIFSFLCALLVEFRTTQILQSSTYADKMGVQTGLPSVVTYGASLYYVSLFMFWALFPSRKWTWVSIVGLVIVEIIILQSGERGEPISLLLTVFFYIFLRNRRGFTDVKIPKKAAIIGLVLVPFFLYGLQVMSYTRVNKDYDAGVIDGVVEFFESQGGSAAIVGHGYDYQDRISDMAGNSFTMGTIRSYMKNNVFARLLFGLEKTTRSTATALEGDSYLASYGYVHSPYTYSKNVGGGSTYVAELYHDGGYLYLTLFNILIAVLLSRLDRAKGNSVISMAILLNIFRYMPLLPRGVALQWLTSTFAIQNLLVFAMIWFLTKQAKEQRRYSPLAQ